jgi:hypothetical protein
LLLRLLDLLVPLRLAQPKPPDLVQHGAARGRVDAQLLRVKIRPPGHPQWPRRVRPSGSVGGAGSRCGERCGGVGGIFQEADDFFGAKRFASRDQAEETLDHRRVHVSARWTAAAWQVRQWRVRDGL